MGEFVLIYLEHGEDAGSNCVVEEMKFPVTVSKEDAIVTFMKHLIDKGITLKEGHSINIEDAEDYYG